MSFPRPIQWYHSHADLIWPDGTFKTQTYTTNAKIYLELFFSTKIDLLLVSSNKFLQRFFPKILERKTRDALLNFKSIILYMTVKFCQ
jgi:hypothetical protein